MTYAIENKGDTAELLIYSDIGDQYLDGVSAERVVNDLKDTTAATINVRLNSGGGSVFDGNTIYNALRRHPARVVVDVDGLAASIASVIAMAGDEVRMADNALMMIHNAWTVTGGDANQMRKVATQLDKANETVLSAYTRRTNLDRETLAAWMDEETWFTAHEAEDHGFVDSVTDGLEIAASVNPRFNYRNTPDGLQMPKSAGTCQDPPDDRWQREAESRRQHLTKLRQ